MMLAFDFANLIIDDKLRNLMRYRKFKAFIFTSMLLLTTFSHLTFAASASDEEDKITEFLSNEFTLE